MVYCGSGTETNDDKFFIILFHDPMVYCGSGTETSKLFNIIILVDPMVYCGSGTETFWSLFSGNNLF